MNLCCGIITVVVLLVCFIVTISEEQWLPAAALPLPVVTLPPLPAVRRRQCPPEAEWCAANNNNETGTCGYKCGGGVRAFYPNRARGSLGRKKWWKKAWARIHGKLKEEGGKWEGGGLLFVGDSLTANLREDNSKGVSELFQNTFGAANPLALGIAGDATQNVIWRVLHDELPTPPTPPAAIVLLVGTNNIPTEPSTTIAHAVLSTLLLIQYKMPASHIVLLGVLPRYDRSHFTSKVSAINAFLTASTTTLKNFKFLDCAATFTPFSRVAPLGYYDFDNLHIKEPGYEAMWRECLVPHLMNVTSFSYNITQ